MDNNWYAMFVKTGEEDNVKARIEYRMKDEIRIVVPKRRLRERKNGQWFYNIRNLFPGYVLLNGYIDTSKYMNFKTVPGIIKLLTSDKMPLRIEDEEIEIISSLVVNDDIIGFSRLLYENEVVRVVDGPLKSMEGLIVSVDKRKGRAKVRLQFMGEERTVDLGISIIESMNYVYC